MAAQNLPLGVQLQKIAAKNMAKVEKVVTASLHEVGANVVTATPVDQGQARRNWMPAIGNIDASTTSDTDKTGSKQIGAISKVFNVLKIGKTFYLTNSLPYIKRLEYDSWSAQAPAGMLRVSIANWQAIVKRNIKRLSK